MILIGDDESENELQVNLEEEEENNNDNEEEDNNEEGEDKTYGVNRTIKRMYIRDKKARNEKKIKQMLGVKVDYSTFKAHPKKIRNFLYINDNTNRVK